MIPCSGSRNQIFSQRAAIFYPGATTEGITYRLSLAMRQTPDAVTIHAGPNGLTKDVNTMKYVRSVTKIKEEMKNGSKIQAGFLGIIERRDHDLSAPIKGINERLKCFCNSEVLLVINNNNVNV